QWFPYSPEATEDKNPVINIRQNLYDTDHGIVMGVKDPNCDDAKVYSQEVMFNLCIPMITFQKATVYVTYSYSAAHKCMDRPIEYDNMIPTFGTHRPLWARYGEYTFLPKQRWLHNLEHGAVVMLYHPCADKNEVNILKILVKKCLYRHIITPYNLLSPEHPLALVTWGHRLEMSKVAPEIVLDFIKHHALKGPEQTAKDGQYDLMLEKHAQIVSDILDHQLCKLYDFIQ
ncbi:uncharacterized protein BDFB_003171, partial [Asbolus verrucosus]